MTRGRAELAAKAVASALAQVPPPEMVWVIEDGVVGKPFDWKKGGPVRITRWETSHGYMAARQKMMMEADAEVYVSLDDDAWFLEPHAIAAAVRVMEEDSRVAAVGFEILTPDRPKPSGKKGVEGAKMFIGCGHALRLKAVREAGGYEKMPGFYGGEEKDLCLRLMDRGWNVVKLNGATVWHEITKTQRDLNLQTRSSVVNDLAIILCRAPFWLLMPQLTLTLASHLFFAIRTGVPIRCRIQGMIDFLWMSPKLVRQRAPVRLQAWIKSRRGPD